MRYHGVPVMFRMLLALALSCVCSIVAADNGDITFTAANQTLELNTNGQISAAIDISGTFTGGNFAFEASVDGSNWRPVRAKRSNADSRESTTGVIGGNPGYYWTTTFGPVPKFRIRCTALSSGSAYVLVYGTTADLSVYETGPAGSIGATGAAGVNSFGAPNTRSLSTSTAYQATDNTKPALVTINLSSTATVSLSGGETQTAQVVIGSTNAVASGTGTAAGRYANAHTGTAVVGLSLIVQAGATSTFALPTGWWFAIIPTGSVTIVSAFDQAVG